MCYHFYLFECLLKWDNIQVQTRREGTQPKPVWADTVANAVKILSIYNCFILGVLLLFLKDFECWVLHPIARMLSEQNANVFQPHKEISKGFQAMVRPAYQPLRP